MRIGGKRRENSFYRGDSYSEFNTDDFWKENRQKLAARGCELLTLGQANSIAFQTLFDLLVEYRPGFGEVYNCLPARNKGLVHSAVPFIYTDHAEIEINGKSIEFIIENYINSVFESVKYIFTCSPKNCIALSCRNYNYNLVNLISDGIENDWIIIFDAKIDKCFNFCFEAGMTIFSRPPPYPPLGGLSEAKWVEYFNTHFAAGIPHASQAYFDTVNMDFVPRIPGLKKFFRKEIL